MRAASAVLEELLILIELTEFGARAAAGGRERWAINCARRAVSANVEQLGPELLTLREGLACATRWVQRAPDDDARNDALLAVERAMRSIRERTPGSPQATNRRALAHASAHRAAQAVGASIECAVTANGHERVAEVARSSFPNQEHEAAHQARRLLVCTKLLPSGADLLVRLDHVEALGKMPSDPIERAWIEEQRVALMADDEQVRMAVLLRHLELVFLPELDRLR